MLVPAQASLKGESLPPAYQTKHHLLSFVTLLELFDMQYYKRIAGKFCMGAHTFFRPYMHPGDHFSGISMQNISDPYV